jgi:hypothetical protein
VPRESETVLNSTKQDFQTISNVTGRIFEIGVHGSDGYFSSVVCPKSEFLSQYFKAKHSWLNASSAKDLAERVRHVNSACMLDPLSTSVYILIRQALPIDMSLLKDFLMYFDRAERRSCRQLHKDGSLRIVQSPECLQILYPPFAADRVSAEASLLTCKILAASSSKDGKSKFLRMMFAGRAEQLLLKLTSCLILVRLRTSSRRRLRNKRVSR